MYAEMEYDLQYKLNLTEDDISRDSVDASSYVSPKVTRDAKIIDTQPESNTFNSGWGFVTDPEIKTNHITSNGAKKSRDNVVNPLYEQAHNSNKHNDNGSPITNSETTVLQHSLETNQFYKHNSESTLAKPISGSDSSNTIWYNTPSNSGHQSLPSKLCFSEEDKELHSKDDSDVETNDKLSTSVKSMWNNFRNGFTVQFKTEFKYDSPIWLLGQFYHCTREEKLEQKQTHSYGKPFITNMERFKVDFSSKLWFTYRKGFAPLPQSTLTSDIGWGCMLRTGQMMMAHALTFHLLSREWRYQIIRHRRELTIYKKIAGFFADVQSSDCPFSIHNLVEIGIGLGKMPGDWFGPASAAHVLSKAMVSGAKRHQELADLCVYVAQDCTVYCQDVHDMCTKSEEEEDRNSSAFNEPPNSSQAQQNEGENCSPEGAVGGVDDAPTTNGTTPNTSNTTTINTLEWRRACIILIPVRLGGVELNDVYIECLKGLLAQAHCLGIIGGKPKHSLYFIGWQDDKAIYLDPHFCQEAVDPRRPDSSLETYHCNSPRKMSFTKFDPSCTIGFYCRTRHDFETCIAEAKKTCFPPMEKQPYPMFIFQNGRNISEPEMTDPINQRDRVLKVRHFDKEGRAKPLRDSDDFVFLDPS